MADQPFVAKPGKPSIYAQTVIEPLRAKYAAALYNNIFTCLIENGWVEETEEDNPMFYPEGRKPTGWWRHPNHPGSFAMDSAYIRVAQGYPKRGD